MNETFFESLEKDFRTIKLGIDAAEFAKLAEEQAFSEAQLEAIGVLFGYLSDRKMQTTIATLLKMSHLPLKEPKTFGSFNFDLIKGKDL